MHADEHVNGHGAGHAAGMGLGMGLGWTGLDISRPGSWVAAKAALAAVTFGFTVQIYHQLICYVPSRLLYW